MIGKYVNIRAGMLLIVDKSFLVKKNHNNGSFSNSVRIKKGQIIEIRFPFEWNFRTECDTYCNCSPDLLVKNCSFYGQVNSDVKFQNKHKLKEILSEGLYLTPNDYQLVEK